MSKLRLRRWWWLMAIGLAAYCGAYTTAREQHWLVHRVSFETDCDGIIHYSHWIDRAPAPGAQRAAYWLFTPLRWSEGAAWQFVRRDYHL